MEQEEIFQLHTISYMMNLISILEENIPREIFLIKMWTVKNKWKFHQISTHLRVNKKEEFTTR